MFLTLVLIFSFITACKSNEENPDDPQEDIDFDDMQEIPVELEEYVFSHESFPRMNGSPSTAPLAQAAACVLLGESREVISEMTVFTRTTQAYRDLAAGSCDIIIAAEPVPGIFDEFAEVGFTIDMMPVAIDALVFIVNASNPVDSLTKEQLKDIYAGNITNWQQIGGEDLKIEAFQRNEEAASQVLIQKLVMDWLPMADAPVQIFPIWEIDEPVTAIQGFDGSPGAIGFTLFYYADVMEMAKGLKIISVDGIKPGTDTISNGTYPLTDPYYVAINSTEPGDSSTRIMYNWLLSDAGQDYIGREGYVPIKDSSFSEWVMQPTIRWDIKTDDSKLLPYTSPYSIHTRLSTGSMQELVPSGTYGSIYPYSSAITMNDGSLRVSKTGFITENGTVITDLIYDSISIAVSNTVNSSERRNAYHLRINIPEPEFSYIVQTKNAACALDGSWITSFDYVDIVFSENVIFLMRDHETFDIDVIDYNGQWLYNVRDLEWADEISDDTWSEMLVYGVNEGYGFIKLKDETYGLIEAITGKIRYTDFIQTFMFSDGLAAVVHTSAGDLWGFVDKDLELVIPPSFVYETAFIDGRAAVTTPDGMQHIIDKSGEVLYSVGPEYFIVLQHEGNAFSLHNRYEWDFPRFFTGDFIEIEYPTGAGFLGSESVLHYVGDGWYSRMTEEGTWLFTLNDAYLIPIDRYMSEFVDGYIIYFDFDNNYVASRFGVMQPDGTDIILPVETVLITPAVRNGKVISFILNTGTIYGDFIRNTYSTASYKMIGLDGTIIGSGRGVLLFDEIAGYCLQGTDHFAFLDDKGEVIFSVPFMGYSFD